MNAIQPKTVAGGLVVNRFVTSADFKALAEIRRQEEESKRRISSLETGKVSEISYREAFKAAEQRLVKARADLEISKKGSESGFHAATEELKSAEDAYQKLGGIIRKTTKEAKDYSDELARNAREQKRFSEDLQNQITEGAIRAMEDGLDKQLEQIEFETQQKLQALDRQQEDLLERIIENAKLQAKAEAEARGEEFDEANFDRTTVQIPTDVTAAFDTLRQQANQKQIQDTARLYANLTNQFKSFEERKNDIAEDYAKKRDALERQRDRGEISIEVFEARLANMAEAEKKAIQEIDDEQNKLIDRSSTLFTRLFSDVSGKSRQTLKQVIDDTKQLLDYLEGRTDIKPKGFTDAQLEAMKGNATDIKNIFDGLIANMDELDRRSSFVGGSFVNALRNFRRASELAKRATEELTDAQREQLELDLESAKRKGFENLMKGAVEVLGVTNDIVGKFKELAEVTGNERMAENMRKLSEGLGFASATIQGGLQGGIAGAAISAGLFAFNSIMDSITETKKRNAEIKKSAEDYAAALELINLTVKKNENIFGERSLQNAIDAYATAQQALEKYNQALKVGFTSFRYDPKNANAGFLGFVKEVNAGLEHMQVETKAAKKGFLGIGAKSAGHTSLGDLAPEIFRDGGFNIDAAKAFLDTNKQLTDEQRKMIQNAIDLEQAYQDAMETVREELRQTFGYIAGDLISLVTDSIKSGTDEWKDFQKVGTKAIEVLGEKLMYELFFANKFDQLQEDLKDALKGGDTQAVADKQLDIISGFFDGIGKDMENAAMFAEEWKKKAAEKGFGDVFGGDQDIKGTAGKWQSLSQATGEEINGRFTAIQISTANIDSTTREILQLNSVIAGIMGDANQSILLMVKQGEQQIEQLQVIGKNTKVLEGVLAKLSEIKNDTQHLR